jgi:very-short-patch-repair endonuclease
MSSPCAKCVIEGIEVDFAWLGQRLIVEIYGFRWHTSRRFFLRDRQRASALAAAGWEIVRLTWHQVVREPVKTAVELALTFARRREEARRGGAGTCD